MKKLFVVMLFAWPMAMGAIQLDTVWTKVYDGPARDVVYSMIPCRDGTFLCSGCAGHYYTTGSTAGSVDDFRIMKVNSSGDTLWTRRYSSYLKSTGALRAVENENGTFAILGYKDTNSRANVWVMMTDNKGDSLFSVEYPCSSGTEIDDFTVDSMGGFALLTSEFVTGFGFKPKDNYITFFDSTLGIRSKIELVCFVSIKCS
jgi:hypothetical protein